MRLVLLLLGSAMIVALVVLALPGFRSGVNQPPALPGPGEVQAATSEQRSASERDPVQANQPAPTQGALEVRVTAGERPAPRVTVEIGQYDTTDWRHAGSGQTDAEGLVRFTDQVPGPYRVRTMHGGSADIEIRAGIVQRVHLQLPGLATVEGRAVTADGGPIAGATITLAPIHDAKCSVPVATTAADGSYRIEHLDGQKLLSASAPGLAARDSVRIDATGARSIQVEHVLYAVDGEVELIVLQPDGRACASAAVLIGKDLPASHRMGSGGLLLYPPAPRLLEYTGQPLRIGELPRGEVELTVVAPGFAPWTRRIAAQPPAITQVQAQLQVGCRVHGIARDAAGKAVAGARVRAGARLSLSMRRTTTAADGSFELSGLGCGPQLLSARHGAAAVSTELVLHDGQVLTWNPVLGAVDSTVAKSGQVLQHDGRPASGYRVYVLPEERSGGAGTETDLNGLFQFETSELAASNLLLIWAPNQRPQDPPLLTLRRGAEEPWQVRLPDPVQFATLSATVRGPDGRAVAAQVEVLSLPFEVRSRLQADDDGRFTTNLGAGQYRVTLRAPGMARLVLELELQPGETRDLGPLTLPPGATIAGRVQGADGIVPAAVSVRVLDAEFRDLGAAEWTGDGYRSDGLQAGTYHLLFDAQGLMPQRHEVTLLEGETKALDVQLQGAALFKIPVRRPAGVALADAIVVIADAAGKPLCFGRVPLGGEVGVAEVYLSPGTYSLRAMAGQQYAAEARFEVGNGASSPPELTLQR